MINCTGKRCLAQYNKVDPATCPAVSYCPQATPPKTNADRIRCMTDEEMAECFAHICYGPWAEFVDNPKKMWLEWLKKEESDV